MILEQRSFLECLGIYTSRNILQARHSGMLIIIGNRKESGLLGNLEHRHILESQPFPSRSLEDLFAS